MDDFNINVLNESKNEWCGRLLNILTPHILEGLKSIFEESLKLCKTNSELDKYLMTFQNFISRIPKWSQTIIEEEINRIIERSGCNYLEDLITCVHIIQLKVLTAVRVGQKQKKIDIDIPKLDIFIHKVYINIARKIYTNVYLFDINVPSLKIQKNNRQIELIIQESIMNTIRDSIPVETILRAYMDETIEEDVIEEIKEKEIKDKKELEELKSKLNIPSKVIKEIEEVEDKPLPIYKEDKEDNDIPKLDLIDDDDNDYNTNSIKFNDIDFVRDENNNDDKIHAPKTFERLDEISNIRNEQRKLEEDEDEEDDDQPIKLKIFDNEPLDNLEIETLGNDEIMFEELN
jgi:hypothetical protein